MFFRIVIWISFSSLIFAAEVEDQKKHAIPSLLSLSAHVVARTAYQDARFAEQLDTQIIDDLQPLVKQQYVNLCGGNSRMLRDIALRPITVSGCTFFKLLSGTSFVATSDDELFLAAAGRDPLSYNVHAATLSSPLRDAIMLPGSKVLYIHQDNYMRVHYLARNAIVGPGAFLPYSCIVVNDSSMAISYLNGDIVFSDINVLKNQKRFHCTFNGKVLEQHILTTLSIPFLVSYIEDENSDQSTVITAFGSNPSHWMPREGRQVVVALSDSLFSVNSDSIMKYYIDLCGPNQICFQSVHNFSSPVVKVGALPPENLVVCQDDGTVTMFDVSTCKVKPLTTHTDKVHSVCFSSHLIITACPHEVRLFDLNGQLLREITDENEIVAASAVDNILSIHYKTSSGNKISIIHLNSADYPWQDLVVCQQKIAAEATSPASQVNSSPPIISPAITQESKKTGCAHNCIML